MDVRTYKDGKNDKIHSIQIDIMDVRTYKNGKNDKIEKFTNPIGIYE